MLTFAQGEANTWNRVEGGSWLPSDRCLSAMKKGLAPYMRVQAKAGGTSLRSWSAYSFQYQGQAENGRKVVYVNAFCALPGDPARDLRKEFVRVKDGGSCYFQLRYDPEAGAFFGLNINGDA